LLALKRPAFWARRRGLAWALYPLSALFGAVSGLRRGLYRKGALASYGLPVPVVVVGNLVAGGAGKTPVVLALTRFLQDKGLLPGIVSRGYGGDERPPARLLRPDSQPEEVGEEPLLLARLSGRPVAVGRNRVEAARLLVSLHPECRIILTDDGLQHYRLQRDLEVVVVDETLHGNGWLLPAGPLREPLSRLALADVALLREPFSAVFKTQLEALLPVASFRVEPCRLYNLACPEKERPLTAFYGQTVHAYAGIGHPDRFFDILHQAGLQVLAHPFPDHAAYTLADFEPAKGMLTFMTEKDAIKCAHLGPDFDAGMVWVLAVEAVIDPDGLTLILEKIQGGSQTA
jgi:tetraacyldisaccharide 4'-kinase